MARGWESKAVADQLEAAEERAREIERRAQVELSPAARAQQERLASLKLSRARTLDQLERATRPAHRQMLQRTLRALENEMEETVRSQES
ncbi:MAG: hypothetical protein QOD00_1820 [Blastocatellia bacterium]|jgi:hypothetical protein|nr:hypothetical protein [Blastocatellia bacterium]